MKKDWILNPEAFSKLLSWLDGAVDSHGERYLEIRQRLVRYFHRRSCSSPEELADETLNRVARKIEEKGEIVGVSPAHYCYIAAKFVVLECGRQKKRTPTSLDAVPKSGSVAKHLASSEGSATDAFEKEKTLVCLEKCLDQLSPEEKTLILDYYAGNQGERIGRRSQLAVTTGLTPNALSIRACRIRSKLGICVAACCNKNEAF